MTITRHIHANRLVSGDCVIGEAEQCVLEWGGGGGVWKGGGGGAINCLSHLITLEVIN